MQGLALLSSKVIFGVGFRGYIYSHAMTLLVHSG